MRCREGDLDQDRPLCFRLGWVGDRRISAQHRRSAGGFPLPEAALRKKTTLLLNGRQLRRRPDIEQRQRPKAEAAVEAQAYPAVFRFFKR